jgi:hypothetical protein
MMPFRLALMLVLAAVLGICGCAGPSKPAPKTSAARAVLPPQQITIHTSPAGGIVDWNGNVLGAAPVTISIVPVQPYADTYPRWPYNGRLSQKFRARWPDGSMNFELFGSNEPIPQNIGIVSPSYRQNPLLDALIKDAHSKQELTQKRTGP